MILGTHTSRGAQNFLMIASINLPTPVTTMSNRIGRRNKSPSAHERVGGQVDIRIKINHRGEVNRARFMPQNPLMIATMSPTANTYVFDVSRHPSVPDDVEFSPNLTCHGHTKEGYGLEWNPNQAGYLLSGSDDAQICLWDIRGGCGNLPPLGRWHGHQDVIEDVAWHSYDANVFGSVGDDKRLLLWDARRHSGRPAIAVDDAHSSDVNSISFHPSSHFLLATASSDEHVSIWDVRNTSTAVLSMRGHSSDVVQVEWAPFGTSVLASTGADRRVCLWDLGRAGETTRSTHNTRSPPELIFVHGGHSDKVSEFAWNTSVDWLIASVSDDNMLQVWKFVSSK
mmetsp:Transcript_9368/g.28670  ORF Transcript_9368/g.28670 Transcript_9368/m.28670 type:complete len:340 (+) Transcript_9368:506-1525(+)